jgi:hypothetical protein
LLQENIVINAISYNTQLEKFEFEVVKQGLFGGKIYFQHDNSKSHIPKFVTEKIAEFG